MKNIIFLSMLSLFIFTSCGSDDDSSSPACEYEPTLVTLEVSDITQASATLNGTINITSVNCDAPVNTEQGFVYAATTAPTINDNQVNVTGTDISTVITNLDPNTTYYVRTFLTNNFGEFYGNEVVFNNNAVYLDDNGITIKAREWAEVGDAAEVNGTEYTIVDSPTLIAMINNDEDVTVVCTSRIVDMAFMFQNSNFNQDIGAWDVSSVTDMGAMFQSSTFNQDIGIWDVSSVTNMFAMFNAGSFNQDIGAWDVSNVTLMYAMFGFNPAFNQDLGAWDVSSVTLMVNMFAGTPFNQDIGDWDVSSVTDMFGMFGGSAVFNQDISDWNVSSVTNMGVMFNNNAAFNQDIGAWDVSGVTDMEAMFFNAASFNQDLGAWVVSNVFVCSSFSDSTTSWVLPQPNFTNCDPN